MKKINVVTDVISGVFILLFVYAALSKLLDFEEFKSQIGKSPILSSFTGMIAVLVPATELLIAFMLMIKRIQYLGLYLALSLMVVFSAYILSILKFSSYIPCSCGGVLENMSWTQHLIFNLVFVCLGTTAILIYPQQNQDLIAMRGKAETLNSR